MRVGLVGLALLGVVQAWGQGVSREVSFPSDGLVVPGTLTEPEGKASVAGWPLVVLVAGSGPQDRDETVGPNKVLKDIAEGLAAKGVATLRYDKRTYLMRTGKIKMTAGDVGKITLAIEVVDDAVAALGYGATLGEIDKKRIFLLGHSLGGTLAPRIVEERLKVAPGSVRGVIEMSAGAVPPNVLLPLQTTFQTLLRGGGMQGAQASAKQVDVVMAEALNPETPADKLELGVPASYWREWANTDAAADLKALKLPALVLHGQKDVQVTYLDYVLMAKAAEAPGSKGLEFAGLDHLYLPVTGESTGDEYMTASHVAPVVMETIAAWLPR